MPGQPAEDDPAVAAGFDLAAVKRSALRVTGLFLAVVLVALLTPGLDTLREQMSDAAVGWLVVALLLEAASGFSYVLMLRPIFLRGQTWWSAQRLGWSELAMGSIVPASGLTGLALGAWVLNRAGVDRRVIARQSIAFYLIKGAVNFIGVAVVGLLMFAGVGPHLSPWLTLFPALAAIVVLGAIVLVPRLGIGTGEAASPPDPHAGFVARGWHATTHNLNEAVHEARAILRRREFAVYFGAFGYWFFDNAVLWATFNAFGEQPAITVILMAYLLGQLGGLIPIPGGVGGVDGGLVGAFVVYGLPAGGAVIAVLTYRVILFWLPLLVGLVAFRAMRKRLDALGQDPGEKPGENAAP